MKENKISLKMGLLDNGSHSLKRGFEVWGQWNSTEDAWLLKESIIWVHHGVELLLKQLLVQNNEFLVFQDVNKAVERLGVLRKREGMEHADVLDLFEHDDKVTSIGFKHLLERVAITLSIDELNENSKLRKNLDKLTRFRNKIVHYSIEINTFETASLISNILDPLLSLLSREIKNDRFNKVIIREIRKTAQPIQEYLTYIRKEIVSGAIESTLESFKNEKHVGIVNQVLGSGLTLTLVGYLKEVSELSFISDKKIFVISDRVDVLTHLFSLLYDIPSVYFHRSGNGCLESQINAEKKIILTTEQKLFGEDYKFNKECLVVGYNLHSNRSKISEYFPFATRILFTNVVNENDRELYGDLIQGYALEEAIKDSVLKPVTFSYPPSEIYNAGIDSVLDVQVTSNIYERNTKLALQIVDHYESIRSGKAIVVVESLQSADEIFSSILELKADWYLSGKEKIAKLSHADGKASYQLLRKFFDKEDSLSIIVCTGQFLLGIDTGLVTTAYVTCPISQQLKYRLVNLVSRNISEENSGRIVDLVGLHWSM